MSWITEFQKTGNCFFPASDSTWWMQLCSIWFICTGLRAHHSCWVKEEFDLQYSLRFFGTNYFEHKGIEKCLGKQLELFFNIKTEFQLSKFSVTSLWWSIMHYCSWQNMWKPLNMTFSQQSQTKLILVYLLFLLLLLSSKYKIILEL